MDELITVEEARCELDGVVGRLGLIAGIDSLPTVLVELDRVTIALDVLRADRAQELVAIAAKQQRDAKRIEDLESLADCVRSALSGHPRCDVHPDTGPVSCGWKRAVADVQHALGEVPQ
ncbi:hypothetical protein [Nocardia sp. NPDC049707]|uniref:hypothetical protein n=1 Tax=Nocardia sp. NPDC049707 TaxID=3154735 RepID=UPI00341C1E95